MTATALRHPTTGDAAPARALAAGGSCAATVGSYLAPIHARWLAEVSRNVLPACQPRGGFWPRWGAVRYLADRFDREYGLEGELLDGLIDEIEPRAVRRLTEGRQALEILRRDLDWIGRRRGTGIATAAIAGVFLQTLRRWCIELERALWALPLKEAPRHTAALLARLDRIAAVRGRRGPQATTPGAGLAGDSDKA
jgi:hypothetical protein